MYRGIKRTTGLFLAAVMLFASLPAYAAGENEAEGVSAETAAETLPQEGEELPTETEGPEAPPEAEGTAEVSPESTAAPEIASEPVSRASSEAAPFTGTSGTCGANLTWTLDAAGTLTITGTGEMAEGSSWSGNTKIQKLVIEEGVTSIAQSAFENCTALTDVTLPESLENLGWRPFSGCTGLKSAGPDGGNYDLKFRWKTDIPEDAFSYCNSLESVTVPEGVKSIGDSAFSSCTALTHVSLPNTLQSIGSSIFSGCTALSDITIPGSVDAINIWAFRSCTNLANVTLKEGVQYIDHDAFEGCENLSCITLPDSATRIDPDVFAKCTKLTTAGPADDGKLYGYRLGWKTAVPEGAFKNCTSLTSVIIPEGVQTIGDDAFWGCTNLASITVPASVTSIGMNIFEGCGKLTSAGPAGDGKQYDYTYGWTEAIPDYAFSRCTNLASITVPASVTSIGDWALSLCDKLTTAGPAGDGHTYDYTFGWESSIPKGAFAFCAGLTSVTIPNTVTSIGERAFYSCMSLENAAIPAGVISIGESAFNGCAKLTGITIPRCVTSISNGAFTGCKKLERVIIPSGVTSIGSWAFQGCNSLASVTIPAGVETIGYDAFRACDSLTSAGPAGDGQQYDYTFGWTEAIPDHAFMRCGSLSSVTLPASIKKIGREVFTECPLLTSVGPMGETADYSVKFGWTEAIPEGAFADCGSLASVTFPDTLTSIGDRAFSSCGLTSVTIPESVDTIGEYAFFGCDRMTELTIREGAVSIGAYSFTGCTCLTEIVIPEGVTFIGARAFDGCTNLMSATIPESVSEVQFGVFEGCPNLATAGPAGDGNAYDVKFGWKTSIPKLAFNSWTGLTEITIPAGVTSIGDYAFDDCPNLTAITIPASVTSIGYFEYWNCNPDLCIYCYPGSYAVQFANRNQLHYELLRITDGGVSTWLSTNAPSGVTAGTAFLIRAGYSAPGADRLEIDLPGELSLDSVWLDGEALTAYTRGKDSLTVSVSALPEAALHTLHLYCRATSGGSYSIGGRLVMAGGTEHSLGTTAVHVENARITVPEKVGYARNIIATGKTDPDRPVTLYVDGQTAEGYSTASNSAGSWTIPFDLPDGVKSGTSHTVCAVIQLENDSTVRTETVTVVYQACGVNPRRLTMYNTGDHGAQETVFDFQDPDAANLIRYYRVWPNRYPSFTFKAEFTGEPSGLSHASVVTVNGAGEKTVIPMAYDKDSGAWVGTRDYTDFHDAPVWVYVVYSEAEICSSRLSADPIMDPSGYVYEAVPSNRLAGVKAEICYQKDGTETSWNANAYDQLNPQTTGPDGSFYWDVPAGSWKVRFTKDGYTAAETEWLPVPPPRVDIGVPMVSNASPEVRYAAVYEDRAEITFSQYMDIDSVKNAITLDGSAPLAVRALDPEAGVGGTVYATRFKVLAAEPFWEEVTFSVSTDAKNYAGKSLSGAYSGTITVEDQRPTAITAPGSVTMKIAEAQDLAVTLAPNVSGRQLTVENLTPAILGVSEKSVTTGDDGGASIPVKALLPGTGLLRISEPVSGLEREISVRVANEVKPEISIEASIADGVLTYEVLNAPDTLDAKLIAASFEGGRMSGAEILNLEGLSGTRTLPAASAGSYVLFLAEGGTWKPLCAKCTATLS